MAVILPNWYYDKIELKQSPSILDGLDIEKESRYRREGARFIINLGTALGLRYDTMATGVVYFHRFYMFHTFKTFPRYVTSCCCLFLAGKVEETPKKCKDIIKTAKSFLTDKQFSQFGDNPKDKMMTLEKVLLQTIKFDLLIEHPYGYLLKYAKSLKGNSVKLQNMVQMAWTFINDSLCTTLCLQWKPEIIAIALLYLAGKLSKFNIVDWVGRLPKHDYWWDIFVEGISVELLDEICHQLLDLLDLYSTETSNPFPDSPPPISSTKFIRNTFDQNSLVESAASPEILQVKESSVSMPISQLDLGELKRKNADLEVNETISCMVPPYENNIQILTSSNYLKKSSKIEVFTQPLSPATSIENMSEAAKPIESVVKDIMSHSTTLPYSPKTIISAETNVPFQQRKHAVASTDFNHVFPLPIVPPFFTTASSGTTSGKQMYPNFQQPPPVLFRHSHQPLLFEEPYQSAPTVLPFTSQYPHLQQPHPPLFRAPSHISSMIPSPLQSSRIIKGVIPHMYAEPPPPGLTIRKTSPIPSSALSGSSAEPILPPGVFPASTSAYSGQDIEMYQDWQDAWPHRDIRQANRDFSLQRSFGDC